MPRSKRCRGKIVKPGTIGVDYNKSIHENESESENETCRHGAKRPQGRCDPLEVAAWQI